MKLLPRSLFSRLVLVLLGGLLTAQLLSFAIHMHDRSELLVQASGMQSAQRIADIVHLLDSMTPAERGKILKVLSAPPLAVSLDRGPLAPADADSESGARAVLFASVLRRYLGDDARRCRDGGWRSVQRGRWRCDARHEMGRDRGRVDAAGDALRRQRRRRGAVPLWRR